MPTDLETLCWSARNLYRTSQGWLPPTNGGLEPSVYMLEQKVKANNWWALQRLGFACFDLISSHLIIER